MFWKFRKKVSIALVILVGIVFVTFFLPNMINFNELEAFDRAYQIKQAKALFDVNSLPDSMQLRISSFYHTTGFGHWLLGKHHRNLWTTPVKLPVFKGLDTLEYVKTGGGQQTTSVEVRNKEKLHYSFRSVNKDNANVLPNFLKGSFLRPFLRDQASAINPFAAPVVSVLLETLEIPHPKPTLYLLPYRYDQDSISSILGGEPVVMVEELNKHWAGKSRFCYPEKIMKTEDVLSAMSSLKIDAELYVRCRLFDFLISDWDRHEKQWKWGVKGDLAWPIPLDRDMALCKYDDGLASKFVRLFNNKFQSFNDSPINLEGLTHNSRELDITLLRDVPKEIFSRQAEIIIEKLTGQTLDHAFRAYPPEIFNQIGSVHKSILQNRLGQITGVADEFYQLINE